MIGHGQGIHWLELDEDISVPRLLEMGRAVVQVGPLTTKLIAGAKWRDADAFPRPQVFANDIEAVLVFLQGVARFDAFVGKVQQESKPDKRNNLLAEARAAFYLVQNGFRIVEWEPLGEGGKTGEFRCMFRDSPAIFVEIKQPGWQGEWMPLNVAEKRRLSSEDKTRRLHRMSQTKFIPGKIESGAVRSHHYRNGRD